MGKISPERTESNRILREWCGQITGHVLSVGSGGDIDKQGGRYREYFHRASSYVTSDVDAEMKADLVLDVRDMVGILDQSVDAVFCSGVLEHVDAYQDAIAEMWRVLRVGGKLILGVPFNQPIHRAPSDYRRWTSYGLGYDLRRFRIEELEALGDPKHPFGYWVLAVKV